MEMCSFLGATLYSVIKTKCSSDCGVLYGIWLLALASGRSCVYVYVLQVKPRGNRMLYTSLFYLFLFFTTKCKVISFFSYYSTCVTVLHFCPNNQFIGYLCTLYTLISLFVVKLFLAWFTSIFNT